MPNPLKVLFLSAEADPFVKVGGLGDVAGSLPHALQAHSGEIDLRLVLPFHQAIRTESLPLVREAVFNVARDGRTIPAQVFSTDINGLTVYLISGGPITGSLMVYDPDSSANGEKYTFFSLAALELSKRLGWKPVIVHANDWHTAAALYAMRTIANTDWQGVKSVYTVHNLGYMGAEAEQAVAAYGLPPLTDPHLPGWAARQPMPLGLWAADSVVAVSPSYALEIQTPEYGYGLEPYLTAHNQKVTGIVNGIDTSLWNPSTDKALEAPFDASRLENRKQNKAALLAQFGLAGEPDAPLMIMVTRMDQQKGVDIALEALRLVTDQPWNAILLGTGNAALEESARRLEADFPERVAAAIRFDGKLSRLMYGAGDILLMPSRYEPCGLTQMIAMRYGCLPLARATGGLRDTIGDGRTGFLFAEPSPPVMAATLRRALQAYANRKKWAGMQKAAMAENFSWQASAEQYALLYNALISKP